MSGVIDVESMTIEDDVYHEFGASFFNSSFLSAGTFADQRAEWLVSVRRSNLDILYDRFSDQPDRPRYADLYSRLRYDISDSLAISANILRAEDEISLADDEDREEQASARQSDSYEWLRLDHNPDGRTSGVTLLARTRLESSRADATTDKQGVSSGALDDVRSFTITTLQSDWSRLVGTKTLLDFGGSIRRMRVTTITETLLNSTCCSTLTALPQRLAAAETFRFSHTAVSIRFIQLCVSTGILKSQLSSACAGIVSRLMI